MKTVNEIGGAVYEIVRNRAIFIPLERKGFHPYMVGQVVKPTIDNDDGNVYACSTAGITGAAEPTWPGVGTVNDGSAVWTYQGAIATELGQRILDKCNEAMNRISILVDIPALEDEDEVETTASQNYSALPADFQRTLFFCYNTTGGYRIGNIHPNYQVLKDKYRSALDSEGSVFDVAVKGSNLHYQYIPASGSLETLTINFFRKPTAITLMTATFAELTEIEEFADNLMIYYLCAEFLNLIEKSSKDRTNAYISRFNAEISTVRMHLGGSTKPIGSFEG